MGLNKVAEILLTHPPRSNAFYLANCGKIGEAETGIRRFNPSRISMILRVVWFLSRGWLRTGERWLGCRQYYSSPGCRWVCVVTNFERLLVLGSTELPDCQCGGEMQLICVTGSASDHGTEARVYCCPACQRELRLTVWAEPTGDLAATPIYSAVIVVQENSENCSDQRKR